MILSIGLFIWSLTALVDKIALSGRIKDKKLYLLFAAFTQIVVISTIVLLFFHLESISLKIIMLAVFAGLIETLKLYYMFTSFSLEEVSRVFPIGVMSSFLVLILSSVFLKEPLGGFEFVAFFLFIIGSLCLAVKRIDKKFRITKAIVPILLTGFIGSAEIVVLRMVFVESGFWTSVFYTRFGLFLGGIIVVIIYGRNGLFDELKDLSFRFKMLITANQAFALMGHVFFFAAVGMANAALVSSAMGIQHVMVFALATIVTLFNPKLVKEELGLGVLIQKSVGIAFIVVAIFILN